MGFPKWVSRKDRRILQSEEEYDPSEVLTVAADGTGNFTRITDAINFAPNNSYKSGSEEETAFSLISRERKQCFHSNGKSKLETLSPLSSTCSIHRVPTKLRSVNDKAYNPKVISIGPFHRGEQSLQVMEEHKWRYLHAFLGRYPEIDLEVYVRALRELEGSARQCYAEPIKLGSHEFVEMMLLDGFFIFVLFLKMCLGIWDETSDPIYYTKWMLSAIMKDLILLENQIPFFILKHLFHLSEVPNQEHPRPSLLELTFFSFSGSFLRKIEISNIISRFKVKHLLDFLRSCHLIPSIMELPQGGGSNFTCSVTELHELLQFYEVLQLHEQPDEVLQLYEELVQGGGSNVTRSVTELQESGVKFKVAESNCFLDISFENGVLKLPFLRVVDSTELIFRNLIAFEQCERLVSCRIYSYARLMDSLINTPKDVSLLIDYGIIENRLGENEDVSRLFNNIGNEIVVDRFYFSGICKDLNAYCKEPWHKWMDDYFNTPWAIISVIAAVVLLILTSLQTAFSVIYKSSNSGVT
ncbi:hypothetical protein HHK36_025752 [Tetracentron sinense]|uniref:Uncharacterized protein n=1 Tax=Tetracentron sinense TaxID=13715 RepID=A0A834YIB2_TETSI|nr:hypothetical protein HHK36_025752 [Tetracentron sinense]